MNKRCVILDYSTPICHELYCDLIQKGMDVWVHSKMREGIPANSERLIGLNSLSALNTITSEIGEIDVVVFDIKSDSEMDEIDMNDYSSFIGDVEQDIINHLETLQKAVQSLMGRPGSQIWVLTREVSAHYHLPVSVAPIASSARHAIIKTIAKEVSRFGIRTNVACIQYAREEISPDVWKKGREGLKTYALGFKPFSAVSMGRLLSFFIRMNDLPLNGVVITLGAGITETL